MDMNKRICNKKNDEVRQKVNEDRKEYLPLKRTFSLAVESQG